MANKGKFTDYLTDMMLYSQEKAKRGWTIQSEFLNVGYIARKKSLIVVAGKNGTLCMDIDCIDEFCEELKGIKEILEARKAAGIRNA